MNHSPLKTTFQLAVFISLFFSFYIPNTHAQDSQARFDSVYIHIATRVASQDIGKAIVQTDSLSRNSENNFQKTKSYLLLALLHEAKGDITDAILYATQAEELAIKEKNYDHQVRSSGYLSTLYRRVDLIKESNRHILIAEKANAKRKSESNYDAIQSVIHHEKSMHEIDNGNYKKALQELVKSEACLKNMVESPEKKVSLAAIYESFAEYYLLIKEFDKAKSKAQKGLELIGESEEQTVGLLHNYLGLVALESKNYEQANKHLQVSEKYATNYPNLSYQHTIYQSLVKYYKAIGNFEKASHYGELVIAVNNKRNANIKKTSNELIVKLQKQEENSNKNNYYLIILAVFLIVITLTIVVLARKKTSIPK